MNKNILVYILGWVLIIEGIAMQLPTVVGLLYNEQSFIYFLIIGIILAVLGVFLVWLAPKNRNMSRKEGFAATALSWILLSITGALPFCLSGSIPNFMDAVFEAVSGFTTTGVTVLVDIEALDKCMLFWRSFTHFIGGMGVVVFLLAIIPRVGGNSGINLMKAESTGADINKTMPKLHSYAAFLYSIYVGLTALEVLFLMLGGMNLYDALTISFSTAGTGGLTPYNDSLAHFDSYYLQNVVAIFMVLFGVNFYAYILILTRRFKAVFKISEIWIYLAIIATATISIAINIYNMYGSIGEALHQSFFYVSSIISTTGVSIYNTDLWPLFSKGILLTIMCIGACAGSTGGGLKVSRVVILLKEIKKELFYIVRPRQVYTLKVDGKKVSHETVRTITVYFILYVVIATFSFLLVSLDGYDMETTFSSIIATLNNIGLGFGDVGPIGNYSNFNVLSKIVFCFNMVVGRLELYPLILLLTPKAWKNN